VSLDDVELYDGLSHAMTASPLALVSFGEVVAKSCATAIVG
jgi:hypothetical protein